MFSPTPSSCLVQVRAEPGGQFTAELLGLADVYATAATGEALGSVSCWVLRQQLDSGSLVYMDILRENPLMEQVRLRKRRPRFDVLLGRDSQVPPLSGSLCRAWPGP